jgi:hypothetical protein
VSLAGVEVGRREERNQRRADLRVERRVADGRRQAVHQAAEQEDRNRAEAGAARDLRQKQLRDRRRALREQVGVALLRTIDVVAGRERCERRREAALGVIMASILCGGF